MAAPLIPAPANDVEAVTLAMRTLQDLDVLERRWQDYQRRHRRGPDPLRQLALSESPDLLAPPTEAALQIAVPIPNQEA
jgi:hypothetical protein